MPNAGTPLATVRRCAVIGSPVTHSRSPELHRAAYEALGLPWRYDAIEIAEPALAGLLAGFGPEWVGLSVTSPLKGAALRLAADADPVARATAAANTLVRTGSSWSASNTDGPGLRAALAEAGIAPSGTACLLGGGATARTTLWALAGSVERAVVLVRSPRRAVGLTVLGLPIHVEVRSVEDAGARRAGLVADVVVDTTPAGAVDWLADEVRPGSGGFVDWTYAPWPTRLATAFTEAGHPVVGGLSILLHQAVGQVELMTGRPAPVAAMRAVLEEPSPPAEPPPS